MATQQQKSDEKAITTRREQSEQKGITRRGESYPSSFANNPFSFMRRFTEQMDRLFEDFRFGPNWLTPSFGRQLPSADFGEFRQGLWAPNVETFEREGKLVIRADLPGLSKDEVNVEVTGNAITISGERRNENEEKREGYYRSECTYGSFYRQIPLPEGVDADDANATFRNGVLEITMNAPKLESRSRKLEISEGGAESQRSQAQTSGR